MVASDADSTETEQLLQRLAQGDRSAMDQLFSMHRDYLRRLIDLRMEDDLRRRIDPSDVVQETQMVASRRIDDFLRRRPTSFRLWLRRKAIEQLIDHRRRHLLAEKRTVKREFPLPDHSSVMLARKLLVGRPSELLQRQEMVERVKHAMQGMAEIDREVLLTRSQ